jgi:photosystem II stability/assembly factor-like uncharacterized protein
MLAALRTLLFTGCLPLCLLAQPPRNNAWRVIGPGGGGSQYMPTVSPIDENKVLVSCDMTGSYLSSDGGTTWRMINLRGRAQFFLFDPADDRVMYIKTIGLFRSDDSGATWRLLHPRPEQVTGISMANDHASERLLTTDPDNETVVALTIDPAESNALYAVMRSSRGTWLAVSSDAGQSWRRDMNLPVSARAIYLDPHSPEDDRTLYVLDANSVSVRQRGAWRQHPPAPGVAGFANVTAGFDGENGFWVWGTSKNLWLSKDGGESWQTVDGPLAGGQFPAVATSLYHPRTAYVSYAGLRIGNEVSFGVARTRDAGESWDLVWRESAQPSPTVDDGWVSARFGPGWGSNPFGLGVSPRNPELVYGTDYGRTLRSMDAGGTWTASYTMPANEGAVTSSGLDVTTTYGVHVDPFDPKRLFISYTDISLFRSETGGADWVVPVAAGIPRTWRNTAYWMEFDPDVQGRLWMVMSGTHDLPRPKMWRSTQPATYRGGVVRSDDGGRSFTLSNAGMPETAATHILLDRSSPVAARVLYVTGFGKGVYRSADGGATWSLKNNGLPGVEPFAWRLAQDRAGTLYVVLARRSENQVFGTADDGSLYRSSDSAESWQRVPLPEGLNGPNGLAIDPDDSQRLYLAAWSRPSGLRGVMGGVWISEDGGRSWRPSLEADQHVYDVTIDPRDPEVLYACGFESSAWRSADRGKTWRRIPGYNFKWGHRVVPDPVNPGMIYITTFGGSVWHGPAVGDSSAPEDIVTPQVAPPR